MKTYIFSHNDGDGYGSGAIALMKYPDAECISINYGMKPVDDFPIPEDGSTVIIVDFSFDMKTMVDWNNRYDLIHIDHHKSAIDRENECIAKGTLMRNSIKGIRKSSSGIDPKNAFAAINLTWTYFFTGHTIPRALYLLDRYDIWDHSDPDVVPFQYGFNSYKDNKPQNKEFWDELLHNPSFVTKLINEGKAIERYVDSNNARLCKRGSKRFLFEGVNFIGISSSGYSGSKIFDSVKERDFEAMMTINYTGKDWGISMYQENKTTDVSKIAIKYLGGGHTGASGMGFSKREEIPYIIRSVFDL